MTIQEFIAVIAGIIMVVTMIPYILDTIRGKTHPNIVSWFTWTLLTAIGTFAAFSEGAITTAIFSLAATLSTLMIVILGLRGGVKRYTLFDVMCQGVALLGIVLWQITQSAELAVAIVVVTDMIAALPTIRHSWIAPHAETWQTFAYGAFSAALTLFTITQFTFTAFAYPVWITFANTIISTVILYRRRKLAKN